MKLDRFQICVIIVGCCLLAYHAVPLVEAHPALKPIIKPVIKTFVKFFKSGEIGAAHKSMEKAIQKIKDNPEKYGLKAADVAGVTAGCIATFTETEDSTTYEVKLTANDDDQCLEIYINDERTGAIAYNVLADLKEDEVNTKIEDAINNAITEYQLRHKSTNSPKTKLTQR